MEEPILKGSTSSRTTPYWYIVGPTHLFILLVSPDAGALGPCPFVACTCASACPAPALVSCSTVMRCTCTALPRELITVHTIEVIRHTRPEKQKGSDTHIVPR